MAALETFTVSSARDALHDKKCSSVELTELSLSAIKEKDGNIHAFLEVFEDAKEQARRADKMRENGTGGVLAGIPLALKDNIVQKGRTVSAGSRILESYTGTYEATVVAKLKEAGAIILGRTNLDEFAMGSSTEHSSFGITKNPHDTARVPGGSSGGSAAAVASHEVLAALGSDTGGSIRQPASYCGVVGLKPTYGSVSRYGLIAMGSSLDVIGPLTKSVTDAELLFSVICGKDLLDSTSREGVAPQKEKITIGVPRHFFEGKLDKDVAHNFEESLEKLREYGFTIKDIEIPRVAHSLAVYYIIMPAEASTNLERYDGVKYGLHVEGENLLEDYKKTRKAGFGAEVRRRILLGTYVLSAGYYDAYYNKATAVRGLITDDFKEAFTDVDVIATPTTPTPAFKIGEKEDPLSMYLTDIFTVPANLTGMPALSVPSGFVSRDGKELPLGLQLMAPHFAESRLFAVGKAFLGE
jgi:aspartyl-tRNA(Asn)/glutamyl-tRNA(Gln) amidotransferase subunit A